MQESLCTTRKTRSALHFRKVLDQRASRSHGKHTHLIQSMFLVFCHLGMLTIDNTMSVPYTNLVKEDTSCFYGEIEFALIHTIIAGLHDESFSLEVRDMRHTLHYQKASDHAQKNSSSKVAI